MQLLAPNPPRIPHWRSNSLCRQLQQTTGVTFQLCELSELFDADDLGDLIGAHCTIEAFTSLLQQGWTTIPVSGDRTAAIVRGAEENALAIGIVDTSDSDLLSRLIGATLQLGNYEQQVRRAQQESESSATELTRIMEEQAWLLMMMQQMRLEESRADVQAFTSRLLVSLRKLICAKSVALFDSVNAAQDPDMHLTGTWIGRPFADSSVWQRCLSEFAIDSAARRIHVANRHAIDHQLQEQGVTSLLAVPIRLMDGHVSWLIAVNCDSSANGESASPEVPIEFGTVEAGIAETAAILLSTHRQNVELLRDQHAMGIGVIQTMSSAIDARDPYTQGHSERVGFYARHVSQLLGHTPLQCERIYICGLLHDVGKIGVPDRVLSKPGKLTVEEFALIKEHPQIGYDIVKNLPNFEDLLPGILHHHESLDGSGYPHGLSGDAIPLQARILAVADAFDAMTSDRPYRVGMSYKRAREILLEGAGTQWDPTVVRAFLQSQDGEA